MYRFHHPANAGDALKGNPVTCPPQLYAEDGNSGAFPDAVSSIIF